MPGFLRANLSIAQEEALLINFAVITMEEMLYPTTTTTPRFYRLNAIVLYVTQPVRKINYTKASKGYGQGARKMEWKKYHRFVVLGVPGSSTVIVMFTPNNET